MFASFFATVQAFSKKKKKSSSKAVQSYSDLTVPGSTWKDSTAQRGEKEYVIM